MAIMSVSRRDAALEGLAEAIRNVTVPDAPAVIDALVEPYVDSDGESALKATIVLDAPDEGGWSADFTHALRRRVNRLAVEHGLDEHVYVSLFTEEEFESREDIDEYLDDDATPAIDRELLQDQRDWS
ncbi:hypothetical protein DI270_016315 [Microbispora triticiradicis]|uniref:Uncharacterized protein n=3 Tax=Microbispora TaxID=2005 RepID=A0ABY3LT39_9ACTN|nr:MULTISPECIES: hypothetical protein [Microbispora]RGA03925.1 hypothetical protein DI270_016315 [Microbispora triticiradicis]TLP60958.1 hypothetical protein FED44_14070 [Microbispora fusca]TYB53044.1 hypothetical protein FXF59_23955 [Microbispora tritici]GLW26038.1 hypothetical protein Mame01_60800 [Microbispora amethystogenes]